MRLDCSLVRKERPKMLRTLPLAVVTAALLSFSAPVASAQTIDSDVPVYLLARAATVAPLDTNDATFGLLETREAAPAPSVAAGAQGPVRPTSRTSITNRQARPLALPALYATLGVLQGMDFYTTQKGMALGAHETNGLIRNGNSGTTMALKTASTAATIFIAERMWKKNKAGAIALMVATNVVFGAVVANNARVIGQLQ